MPGNRASTRPDPRLLLDESLIPAVARALALVGYDVVDAVAATGRQGASDPEIIDWCRRHGAAWIHADDRARRQHKALLQTSGIRTLWVYRERGRMSGKEQLRILAFTLPRLVRKWEESPGVRHYRASAVNPESVPSLRPVNV